MSELKKAIYEEQLEKTIEEINGLNKANRRFNIVATKKVLFIASLIVWALLGLLISIIQWIYEYGQCNIWGSCRFIYQSNFKYIFGSYVLFLAPVISIITFPFFWFIHFKKMIQTYRYHISNEINLLEKSKKEIENVLQEQEEADKWQKQLDRDIAREKALGQARNETVLQAMQNQLLIMNTYREKGLDVERQAMEMRKELLELEGKENETMLNQLKTALDSIDSPIASPQS